MPQPVEILHAELRHFDLEKNSPAQAADGKVVKVQFNPQTLKVTSSNQMKSGEQPGGSSLQYAGAGSSKLSLELWFDVTAPHHGQSIPDNDEYDVRQLVKEVEFFVTPIQREENGQTKYIAPGVRFIWGKFLFDGVVESMDTNLEFFSEDGVPLRASVSFTIVRHKIEFQVGDQAPPNRPGMPDLSNQAPSTAKSGDSVQKIAGQSGQQKNWQAIARANGIENPRQIAPGTSINLNVRIN